MTNETKNFIEDRVEDVYYDPIIKLLFNLFGSLLPLIITVPIILLTTKWPGFNFFADKGQFCLYSAAFFSPTIYLLYKYKGENTFDKYLLIFILTFLGILFCVVIYTVIRFNDLNTAHETIINTWVLQLISILLFVGSLIVLFYAQSLENKRGLELQGYNYRDSAKSQFEEFANDFRDEQ